MNQSIVVKRGDYLGVSKNKGTPKWMVYNGNPIKMDDLGVPPFSETPISLWGFWLDMSICRNPLSFQVQVAG